MKYAKAWRLSGLASAALWGTITLFGWLTDGFGWWVVVGILLTTLVPVACFREARLIQQRYGRNE